MFLLNDRMILNNRSPRDLLDIAPFDQQHLGPTFYYFGLGRKYQRWNAEKENWEPGELAGANGVLTVKPDEFLLIETYERFRCSKQTIALFGQSSRLFRLGLSLRHSPFIDPNFPHEEHTGYLELGLKNELPRSVRLALRDRIGKVCFFNISDTYPVGDMAGRPGEADFVRRSGEGGPTPRAQSYDNHPVPGWEDSVGGANLNS